MIRYDLSQLSPNFSHTGFLQYPQPFLILSLQVLMVLTSHLCHTFIWASVDNMLTEPRHFLFTLQLNPGFFLKGCHYCFEWTNSSSALGIQSPKESQPRIHKSLKWCFPCWLTRGSPICSENMWQLFHPFSLCIIQPLLESIHYELIDSLSPRSVHSPVDKLTLNTYS